MVKLIRVNYAIAGYDKFASGVLVNEDANFLEIKTKDGKMFRIRKDHVTEERRWSE